METKWIIIIVVFSAFLLIVMVVILFLTFNYKNNNGALMEKKQKEFLNKNGIEKFKSEFQTYFLLEYYLWKKFYSFLIQKKIIRRFRNSCCKSC